MRKILSAALCACMILAGIPFGWADQYPVRATYTPPTVGAACDAVYESGIYIDIDTGDEYYCDTGLWAKRTPGTGGGSAWAKGLDEDQDGTNVMLLASDFDDTLYCDNDQDGVLSGEECKITQGRFAVPYPNGGIIFDADNGTGLVRVKLCTADFFMFYDADTDNAYDAGDDYCWGVGGYDFDCDCTIDYSSWVDKGIDPTGTGVSPVFEYIPASDWFEVNPDAASGDDYALFGPKTIDGNGDGIAELSVVGGIGGLRGDGLSNQTMCNFPGGYSSDPFDYAQGFCTTSDTGAAGSFFPITSDPNYGVSPVSPRADIGNSTYRWRSGYFDSFLYIGSITFNSIGYANTYNSGSNYFSSYGGQYWLADANYDDTTQRTFSWRVQTGASTQKTIMAVDQDATPEMWVDVDGDNTYDIRFDGDEPADGESIVWNTAANAVRWGTGGGGDDLYVDGSATVSAVPNLDDGGDIDFTYAAPNITAAVKADSVALGTDTTGNYAGSSSEGGAATTAAALASNPSPCGTGEVVTDISDTGALTCTAMSAIISQPWKFVELWDDFLRPGAGISITEDEMGLATDAASGARQHFDADTYWDVDNGGTESDGAVGVIRMITGTTTDNDSIVGFGGLAGAETSSLNLNVMSPRKHRLFRARWANNFADGQENAIIVVGVMGESDAAAVAVMPDSKEAGMYFFCDPDSDLDDDGGAGDAEDDNIWFVADVNLGAASDTVCLKNGGGGCTPDANRQAWDTGLPCTGAGAASNTFVVGEIEHDGAGNWTARLDNDTDDSTWDWTQAITASFSNDTHFQLAGVAMRNNAEASSKSLFLDYIYYYGTRF